MICQKERNSYIASTTEQFNEQMQNSTSNNQKSSPLQLLDQYPFAKEIGWSVDDILFLFEQKLIKGELEDELLILNHSFEQLLEFYRKQQDSE